MQSILKVKSKVQTKSVLFTVNPPNSFDFQKPEEWKNWKTRFDRYSSISGLKERDQQSQIDALIYTMGPEAERIFNSLSLTKEERNLYHEVVQKLEDYLLKPSVNVIYERAKFNQRVQKVGESFDAFVAELSKLAENCRFGAIKEEYIRDRIVAGMSDGMLSNLLQTDPDLTLDKAIAMAKESEFVEAEFPTCPSPCPLGNHDVVEQKSEPKKKVIIRPKESDSNLETESSLSFPLGLSSSLIGTGTERTEGDKVNATEECKTEKPIRRKWKKIKKQQFVCPFCTKTFKTISELTDHMKSHSGKEPFSCKICGLTFSQFGNLKKHKLQIHPFGEKKPVSCEVCGKKFKGKANLRIHREIHSEDKVCCEVCGILLSSKMCLYRHIKMVHDCESRFSCEICGKKYRHSDSLKLHRKAVHFGVRSFSCKVCGKKFPYSSGVRKHNDSVHLGLKPLKAFACSCGRVFSSKRMLVCHMRIHTGEKPFSCNDCGKSFSRKSTLSLHVKIHTVEKQKPVETCEKPVETCEKPFSCDICMKSFMKKKYLWSHKKLKHPETYENRVQTCEKPFSCDICMTRFMKKEYLCRHKTLKHPEMCEKRVQTCEKLFSCDICLKSFANKRSLYVHKNKIHPGSVIVATRETKNQREPVCCDICGVLQMDIKTHLKTHSGPFSCQECGKKFKELRTLKKHKGVHGGDRPFCCHVCGKTYLYRGGLRKHERIQHAGIKPERNLPCSYCEKRFYTRTKLNNHVRTHTGEKPFSCDVCEYRCAQKQNLKSHKMIHKKNRNEVEKTVFSNEKEIENQGLVEQNVQEASEISLPAFILFSPENLEM